MAAFTSLPKRVGRGKIVYFDSLDVYDGLLERARWLHRGSAHWGARGSGASGRHALPSLDSLFVLPACEERQALPPLLLTAPSQAGAGYKLAQRTAQGAMARWVAGLESTGVMTSHPACLPNLQKSYWSTSVLNVALNFDG